MFTCSLLELLTSLSFYLYKSPIGALLTSILPYPVKAISSIESNQLKDVSFYLETSDFVKHLTTVKKDIKIVVTGHCKYHHDCKSNDT